jgi:NitT/TauT family transport system permease protein
MKPKLFSVRNILLQTSGLTFLIILWEALPGLGIVDPRLLPRFSTVVWMIYRQWQAGFLWVHLMVSLWRAVTGLLIAMVIGIPLGFLLGRFGRAVVEAFNPLFRVLSQANPFSLMPVFILFFGIGEMAKLAVISWVCLWPVLFNTITGVQSIDPQLIKSARSFGLKKVDLATAVLLPAAAPAVFIGLRIGVEMAFFILIASEMIGATAGLGWLLHQSAHLYQVPRLYAAATCIIILGVFLNRILLWLELRLFFWRETEWEPGKKQELRPKYRLNRLEITLVSLLFLGILILGGQLAAKVNREGGIRMPHSQHQQQLEDPSFGSSGGI